MDLLTVAHSFLGPKVFGDVNALNIDDTKEDNKKGNKGNKEYKNKYIKNEEGKNEDESKKKIEDAPKITTVKFDENEVNLTKIKHQIFANPNKVEKKKGKHKSK